MAEVQFGRRKGSLQSPSAAGDKRIATSECAEVDDVKPCQVAVIPAAEWQRIKGNLSHRAREAQEQYIARQRREDRKLQSQNIVKHWENTIEGQRLKKLQARELREEKEEQERIKVDNEERDFQAQCRKDAIERAKTLLYHQTDHVKTFHSGLLLSEVLRERDAQLQYKKRKQEAAKMVDQKYIRMQEEEREKGIAEDQKAAVERAKAKFETSKFQAMQVAEKQRQRERARDEACAEQKKIDKEVEEFLKAEAAILAKKTQVQQELRAALDHGVRNQADRDARRQEQELAEDKGIQLFQQAKKRMSQLRKEKEQQLFQQFQSQQKRMADLLLRQRQEERSTEDDAISKAMEEQYAKKEQAELEKERQFMEQTQEIQKHRIQMMTEKERREREQQEANRAMLQNKREHDLKFHQAQQEKAQRAYQEAKELQQFLRNQVAEKEKQQKAEKREEKEMNSCNQHLMEVEQRQFSEYADRVLSMARARGAPTQPLVKAAQAGAGGGRGPNQAGIKPSYQAMDSTAVELPSYQPKDPPTPANTQKRMGFTW